MKTYAPVGVKEARRFIEQLQAVKLCPVTNGLPTVMTKQGFKAACKRARKQDKGGYSEGVPYKYTH